MRIIVGRQWSSARKLSAHHRPVINQLTTKDTRYHEGTRTLSFGAPSCPSWLLLFGGLQVALHGFLHHRLQWYTVLGGNAAAVLVFRSVTAHGAIEAGNLDADISEPG